MQYAQVSTFIYFSTRAKFLTSVFCIFREILIVYILEGCLLTAGSEQSSYVAVNNGDLEEKTRLLTYCMKGSLWSSLKYE
jgi:hypothetical protein